MRPGYKRTEVGVIPDEWDVVTAAELCELVVDCKNRTPPISSSGSYGVVRTSNVRNGRFVRKDLRFTDLRSYREWTARAIPQAGDVLITREAPLGEVCAVPSDLHVCLGQRMMLYRPNPELLNSGYLLNALMSSKVQRRIQEKIGGSTVGHASVHDLRTALLPLPPSNTEQTAIAQAISDAADLVDSLERLVAKKRQVKQGAMQELLTGKRRLPGFGDAWRCKCLSSLGTFLKGAGITKDEASADGLPCVRYGEIYTQHHDYIRVFVTRIPPAVAATATRIRTGDILFAGSGETKEEIGKCVAFVGEYEAYAGGDIVILRVEDADSRFLGYFLNSGEINRQKASYGQGDAVVHISATALGRIQGRFPPVPEQRAIASLLSDMDGEIEALEAKLDKARQIKQGMMQELLTGRIRLV